MKIHVPSMLAKVDKQLKNKHNKQAVTMAQPQSAYKILKLRKITITHHGLEK